MEPDQGIRKPQRKALFPNRSRSRNRSENPKLLVPSLSSPPHLPSTRSLVDFLASQVLASQASSQPSIATRSEGLFLTYPYRPLNKGKNEIRLLRVHPHEGARRTIRCDLLTVPLDNAPTYEALSYTWGNPSKLAPINIDGNLVLVRKNLERALYELQDRNTERILWIDAICIDQENEEERSSQVRKMRDIYARASNVLVWLGKASDGSDLAFSLLEEIRRRFPNPSTIFELLQSPETLPSLEGLSNLFSRGYWWRVWVIQEVNFAKSVTVHCGSSAMDWDAMLTVQQALRTAFGTVISSLAREHWPLRELHQAVQFRGPQSLLLDRAQGTTTVRALSLFEALLMHRLKLSTDPRDKVYALVGLTVAKDDPDFTIDYSLSTRQVYINTVDKVLQSSQSLDIICAKTKGTEKPDLPSWVPNWASTCALVPIPFRHAVHGSLYSASKDIKAEARVSRQTGVLEALGVQVGSVQTLGQSSEMMDMDDYYHTSKTFCAWLDLLIRELGAGFDRIEQCAQLFLCEIYEPEDLQDRTPSEFLQSVLGAIFIYISETWPDIEVGAQLKEYADQVRYSAGISKAWIQTISQIFWRRRFFITTEESLGLAEEHVRDEDIVCILFGCSIPVILRNVGDHYIYVSDACVVGYMYGKGIEDWKQGRLQSKIFEIH